MALAMGLGRLLDGLGAGGCPPAPGSVVVATFALLAALALIIIAIILLTGRP